MEFVQFHPTGMVWPPSVRGILVTEGVRGEGGVLRNKDGQRFMFDDIPDNYKNQTADNEEEGWRYTQGDKTARRPPELLTRDHVARCIIREVKAGRGTPHGGVFLDIVVDQAANPQRRRSTSRSKLPSMYHQFKELADVDITKEPMEVGPTTHYMMGGVRVDGDTQMSTVPGLFAAGEVAAGLHGANRLGGNSLSDLLVLRQAGRRVRRRHARRTGRCRIDERPGRGGADGRRWRRSSAPKRRDGAGPYQVQHDLQGMMQDLVGIVRTGPEMVRALEGLETLRARAERVGASGNREYNPGWHTALDLPHQLIVSEAIARSALERTESRGAHFRDDYPAKDEALGKVRMVVKKGTDGRMQLMRVRVPPVPPELQRVIEEMK